MPYSSRHLSYTWALALMLFSLGQPLDTLASAITPATVVELVNQERTLAHVPAVTVSEQLMQAAQAKADDMAARDYFAHTSPEGKTPWSWFDAAGYHYRYAGENLAIHFTSAEDQQAAWMKSLKHRKNILSNKYQEMGVGIRTFERGGEPVLVTVQLFGTRLDAKLSPSQPLVAAVETEYPIRQSETKPLETIIQSKETVQPALMSDFAVETQPVFQSLSLFQQSLLLAVLAATLMSFSVLVQKLSAFMFHKILTNRVAV